MPTSITDAGIHVPVADSFSIAFEHPSGGFTVSLAMFDLQEARFEAHAEYREVPIGQNLFIAIANDFRVALVVFTEPLVILLVDLGLLLGSKLSPRCARVPRIPAEQRCYLIKALLNRCKIVTSSLDVALLGDFSLFECSGDMGRVFHKGSNVTPVRPGRKTEFLCELIASEFRSHITIKTIISGHQNPSTNSRLVVDTTVVSGLS